MDVGALLQLAMQTGFAGLFVWLLFDTRKESREREKDAFAREQALVSLLTTFSEKLPAISEALDHLGDRMETVERNTATAANERSQILQMLGDRRGSGAAG